MCPFRSELSFLSRAPAPTRRKVLLKPEALEITTLSCLASATTLQCGHLQEGSHPARSEESYGSQPSYFHSSHLTSFETNLSPHLPAPTAKHTSRGKRSPPTEGAQARDARSEILILQRLALLLSGNNLLPHPAPCPPPSPVSPDNRLLPVKSPGIPPQAAPSCPSLSPTPGNASHDSTHIQHILPGLWRLDARQQPEQQIHDS